MPLLCCVTEFQICCLFMLVYPVPVWINLLIVLLFVQRLMTRIEKYQTGGNILLIKFHKVGKRF